MLQYAQYEMQRFNEKCINSLQNAKQAYRRQTGSYYVSNGEAPPTLKIKPGNGFQSVCFYLTKGSWENSIEKKEYYKSYTNVVENIARIDERKES